jgi:hypothetical protein
LNCIQKVGLSITIDEIANYLISFFRHYVIMNPLIYVLPTLPIIPVVGLGIGRALGFRNAAREVTEYTQTRMLCSEASSVSTCYEIGKNGILTCYYISVSGSVTRAKIRGVEDPSALVLLKGRYGNELENRKSEALDKLTKTRKELRDFKPKYRSSTQEKEFGLKELDSCIQKIEADNASQLLQLSPELFA